MNITRQEIKKAIVEAGISINLIHAPGGPLQPELNMCLQQNPDEFSEFIFFMANKMPPAELSLEIGVASGGQAKLLRDFYQCKKTIIVDLGMHPEFKLHWHRIKAMLKTDIIMELIMDSHSSVVKDRLGPYKGMIDFAFIDGDHSYEGLKKDIALVKEFAKPGCVFVLHDTKFIADCRRVADELLNDPDVRLLREFNLEYGISIWKLNSPPDPFTLNQADMKTA
jgi:hypothetical protein